MKYLLSILILFASIFGNEKPITVRVLLKKLAPEATLEVKGRHLLYNPKTETYLTSSNKKKKAKIVAHDKGLFWGDLLSGTFEIRIVPDEKNCSILVDGIQYKGWVEVYNIGGTINVINEVDAENYLKSTLNQQPLPKLSKESIDALVITERTNLYHEIEKGSYASWQLDAEKGGYFGILPGRAIDDAVERTRDLILRYKKKTFAASWGLDHCGRSVSFPSINRKACVVPPGVDNLPSLQTRTKSRWKSSITLDKLAEIAGLEEIKNIDRFKAEKSEKNYALRLIGNGESKDVDFRFLQEALGKTALLSNDFSFTIKGKKVHFTGYGKGLGTGLCLASSEILAARKASVEKILTTHFPGAKLVNMREESGTRPSTSPAFN